MTKLTFNSGAIEFILKAFGAGFDSTGQIVNLKTKEQIFSPEGESLTALNFGGIKRGKNGEVHFLKNDLLTAIKLTEQRY